MGTEVKKGDRIYVAGHNGLVGSALVRGLLGAGASRVAVVRALTEAEDPGAAARWLSEALRV